VAVPPTLGVILAGGLARRMGGADKAFIRIGDKTILERVTTCLAPQCRLLVINANGDLARFAGAGIPVIADTVPDYAGPLAGILTALDWAATNAPRIEWIVSAPCDCPFLPHDLVEKLHEARVAANTPLACASSARTHPVIAIWPVALRGELRRAVRDESLRKVESFLARHGVALASWPAAPVDPFFNVNTPADIAEGTRLAAQLRQQKVT
jgi:molybdenum cofactor guanylyltransferase